MKLEFDPVADAAYFEISATEVETSKEIESGIIVDYDKDGHVVGIEVLSISAVGCISSYTLLNLVHDTTVYAPYNSKFVI